MILRPLGLACALLLPTASAAQQPAPPASAPAAPAAPAAPGVPAAPAAATTLTVAGDVTTPLTLTAADLAAMPRTKVDGKDDGRAIVYEGVLVGKILEKAGVPVGSGLRGAALATYVLATASDGYRVLYSLGELDPAMTSNDIIVADSVDGKPLFGYRGPFRIVAPKDARGARSVRMLQRLEVVRVPAK